MKKLIIALMSISMLAASCTNSKPQLHKDQVLQIKTRTLDVQLADTPSERAQGLSGLPYISEKEGMLFLFSQPQTPEFWMKDMKFAIDIIWIKGDRIVAITDAVKPEPGRADSDLTRYSPPDNILADKVLEVSSGWAFRNDINVNDTITLINP